MTAMNGFTLVISLASVAINVWTQRKLRRTNDLIRQLRALRSERPS